MVRRWPRRWMRRLLLVGPGLVLCAGSVAVWGILKAFPVPLHRLAELPQSPEVRDRRGRLLGARVGPDDQWRRPVPLSAMSPWLVPATLAAEDQRFFLHPGVDPIAVGRALLQNLGAGRVQSGASTLTMQLCRMLDERPRTLGAKAIEATRALAIEHLLPKEAILEAYLNLAPYGGNLRGVEAAAQAYFGKRALHLSLAESALLAGLPQSPERLRPTRSPRRAARRRAFVLRRMRQEGLITTAEEAVALVAPIPLVLHPRPRRAPHAVQLALARRPRGGVTTIDRDVQDVLEDLTRAHRASLPAGTDLAVLVVDIPRGEVRALLGSADVQSPVDGWTNGVLAWRSPGSALKPFVYAAAFEAGRLAPASKVYDVPIVRSGWAPRNFDGVFRGPIEAGEALRRSLNIPAILVAEGVGLARVIGTLEACGVRLRGGARRGGLAVVTGALEVTLWDLVQGYATLGRGGRFLPTRLFADGRRPPPAPVLRPAVAASISEVLSARARSPRGLEPSSQVPFFMWKTGTSSRHRDAWAVGHNRRFAIGVWIGRFSGAGRQAYTGAEAAEPLLARLFAHPLLRARRAPPPATRIAVSRPLAPPSGGAAPLRIFAPHPGAALVSLGGSAVVRPRASHPNEALVWFLDGRRLGLGEAARLELPPGGHELRCVDAQGAAAAVRFSVR